MTGPITRTTTATTGIARDRSQARSSKIGVAVSPAQAVYVADISGMPSLIANTMTIPRMRKRPYPTLLDRSGDVTAAFPSQPGQATLLRLERLRIQAVLYVDSVSQLREALGVPAED